MGRVTSAVIGSHNHKTVRVFRITNPSGSYIEVMNYGATLVSVVVPDSENRLENVVLSYGNKTDYFSDPYYLGSTIGRVANRIKNGRFCLNGETHLVDKNHGDHSLHGGALGFNAKVLEAQADADSVTFYGVSPDGENGFRGNVIFAITYTFSDNNELLIGYKATSDKVTPLNLTNHAYFNLYPEGGNILQHRLKVYADSYLEMDEAFLPTGKIIPLKDSPFDFSAPQEVAKLMALKNEAIKGYNTYYISPQKEGGELIKLASVKELTGGRSVDVYSTMPGVLFYTGDYLKAPFSAFGGLCLEAQYPPDYLNHSHFDACYIGVDKAFDETIKFAFNCHTKASCGSWGE